MDRIADELAIRRTLADYCQLLDDGRFQDWLDMFTPDVTFVVMGNVLHGREALLAFIEPTQPAELRGKHMLSEPVIAVSGDQATAATDYAFVARDLSVLSAGRYVDRLVRGAERWRIAAREIVFVGDEPS